MARLIERRTDLALEALPVPAGRAPLVFATLACLGSMVDAWAATAATAFTVVMAGSLGAGFGLGLGVLTALSVRGVRRLPRRVAWGVLPLAGAGGGMLWADALGAFTHLTMGHVGLGALTLALATTAGVACGLVPALLAPTARFPAGPGLARGEWPPVVVLAIAAAALTVIERAALPPFYTAAHDGAAVLALASASLAVWLLVGRRGAGSGPSPGGVAEVVTLSMVAMVAMVAVAYVGLGDTRYVETQALLSRTLPGLALRFGRALTDVDVDGASGLLGGGDCAPFDGAVQPEAPEVPDNGVDDNCVAGDARASARVTAPPIVRARAGEQEAAPLSVVIVTIDTLRPDRTTAYDAAVATTPHLGRWATSALRFERAYTAGMSTNVSIPSLLTGMYPRRLRWKRMWGSRALDTMRTRLGARAADIQNHGYTLPLDDEAPWLAERLAAREMHTAAVVDDGGTFLLRRETVGRGFAEFHEIGGDTAGATGDAETARVAVATLQRLAGEGRPFFLWVHAYGPHEPLPDASRAIGATPREYDRAIAATDRALGPLFEALDRVGAGTPLAAIVTADHAEALRSWTRGHGGDLFGGVPRVPLLVRAPGVRAGSTDVLTSLVDVVPTVLALTGQPAAGFDGSDLTGVLFGRAPGSGDALRTRVVLADAWIAELQRPSFRSHAAGALDGRHALSLDIRYRGKSLFELPDEALPPRNRIAEVDPGRLEHALFDYLENTAGEPALD